MTPAAELRSQAAISVAPDVQGDDEVRVRELAGGRCAVVTLEGPYSGLGQAYAALYDWLATSATKRGDGPIVEVYLNDPHMTAPADLVTEIRLPIA